MLDVELPPLVARYRELGVAAHAPLRTLRLRHHGTFCVNPTAKPAAISGEQLFTSDPPGFLWTGRVHMFPGLWVDARDMCVGGLGSMRVLLDDTLSLVDAKGSEIDQGSALRLLAEMAWYPTALFDRRWVTWQALDTTHASATLRIGDQAVSGIFEFGANGLLAGMQAERFMDKAGLKPWGGIYRDWRTVSGMQVPFEVEVWWQLDTGRFTYAHWLIDSLAFDAVESGLSRISPLPDGEGGAKHEQPTKDGFVVTREPSGKKKVKVVGAICGVAGSHAGQWALPPVHGENDDLDENNAK